MFLFEYILKCNLFLWCKAECSVSLLQSSVSHDPSEIILTCWFSAKSINQSINQSIDVNVVLRNLICGDGDPFFYTSIIKLKSTQSLPWQNLVCVSRVKGIVHQKMKVVSYTYSHVAPNLYEFLSSVEHEFILKNVGDQAVAGSHWLPLYFWVNGHQQPFGYQHSSN